MQFIIGKFKTKINTIGCNILDLIISMIRMKYVNIDKERKKTYNNVLIICKRGALLLKTYTSYTRSLYLRVLQLEYNLLSCTHNAESIITKLLLNRYREKDKSLNKVQPWREM